MKVAKAWRAEEVRVRLCFFVKVRKAKGRSVAGGSKMGNIEGFEGSSGGLLSRRGWTGVPKAGEDEGMGSGPAGVGPLRNRGAVRGALIGFSIFYCYFTV